MNRITIYTLATGLFIGIGNLAHAQTTFFSHNATIDYALSGDAYIGDGTTSPTVNLVSSGSISGGVQTYNNSLFNMSGGSVNGNAILAADTSQVNLTGGTVKSIQSFQRSLVNISGGSVTDLVANGGSGLNIFGKNITQNLIDPNYALFPMSSYRLYTVSGTLLDGSVLTNTSVFIQNGLGAGFYIYNTPAPSSALVLLLGTTPLLGVLRKRHKSARANSVSFKGR